MPTLLAALRRNHRRMERGLEALAAGAGDDVATRLQMAQLAEVVHAHFALEEERLFARASEIDSAALAEALASRRAELLGEPGPD